MSIGSTQAEDAPEEKATNAGSSAWLEYAVLALVAAAVAFDLFRYADDVIDDTFISLRYARNWVEGHGLVFNPGARVEGYTNFSFVAEAAVLLRLGIDPVLGTKVLSIFFSFVTLAALARMERLESRPSFRLMPASVVLLLPLEAFVYWSAESFETMPFTGLLTVALWRLLAEGASQRGHLSAFFFALLALTRPEGVLLFLLCTGAAFAVETFVRPCTAPLRRHAVNVLLFAACYGPYFAWRTYYYGRLFPNTFYAKVTGGSAQLLNGLTYLGEFAVAFPVLTLALLVPPLVLLRRGRFRDHVPLAVVHLVVLGYTAYLVSVGGDFMPFFRFFVPILPLCCLLLAWSLARLPDRFRARRYALPAAVVVGLLASHATEQPYRAFVAHRTAQVGEQVGSWLARQLGPDDLVAVNTAGAVPYFSRLPSIDTLGLADASIAHRSVYIVSTGWAGHRKGWGDYVLSRRPRVILWYNSAGSREPFYLGDHELAESPMFRFFYRAKAATLPQRDERVGHVLERFLGDPFEVKRPGTAYSPDLGLAAELYDGAVDYSVLRDSPVTVSYFELDERDAELWPKEPRGNLDQLLQNAVELWQATPPHPVPDPQRTAQVEALCDEARRQVQSGDYASARKTLSAAARQNATVRSPLVYQYIANVAVMTGDLLVAIGAQKEALRLAPANPLYRSNLQSLLTIPFEKGSESRGSGRREVRPRE